MISKTVQITELSLEELKQILTDIMRREIEQLSALLSNEKKAIVDDCFLNRKQVCALFKISNPTVIKLTRQKKIKGLVVGGSYRYLKSDILKCISKDSIRGH
jgi:excisionase family DNA binding protein